VKSSFAVDLSVERKLGTVPSLTISLVAVYYPSMIEYTTLKPNSAAAARFGT